MLKRKDDKCWVLKRKWGCPSVNGNHVEFIEKNQRININSVWFKFKIKLDKKMTPLYIINSNNLIKELLCKKKYCLK
jgi:hypothetical protein